jgi:signal transduction histidine kinase/CheY-like chemotaxis protein
MVDAATDALLLVDGEGRILDCNAACRRLLGCAPGGLLVSTAAGLDQLSEPAEVVARLRELAGDLRTEAGDQVRLHDGRALECSTRPLQVDGEIVARLWRFRDLTDRTGAELELAQRMDAIGRLAGGVAHDFNNLLTAILGFSHSMLEEVGPEDPRREDLLDVIAAAERGADLTRQLLAFSRRQVLQPKVVNLNDLVRALERLLRRVLGEDVSLVTRLDPRLAPVKADPGQIEQVIVNLAVNAREAMPQGGRLTLETRNLRFTSVPEVARSQGPLTDYVALRVSDTGVGMAPEVVARIFEPFFTTKTEGTGLGLSMAYGIVKQTGGHIEVTSAAGRGTTFTVYLPVTTEPVESAGRGAPGRQPAPPDTTILLAEDEDAVRRLITRLLTADGYRVLEAANGEEAMAVSSRWPGSIDLLLTDLVMPRMNGRELAETIRLSRAEIRVAFMSGYAIESYGRNASPLPGTPFLPKPFDAAGIRLLVRSALEREEDPS